MVQQDFIGSIRNPGFPPNSMIHGQAAATAYPQWCVRMSVTDFPPVFQSSLFPSASNSFKLLRFIV